MFNTILEIFGDKSLGGEGEHIPQKNLFSFWKLSLL